MSETNAQQDNSTDAQKVIGRVSALAMSDEQFKVRLKFDPASVLGEHGLEVPSGMDVQVLDSFEDMPVERGAHTLYLVVPAADGLSHEDMKMVNISAASCQSTASTACTTPSCISSASTASTNSCT